MTPGQREMAAEVQQYPLRSGLEAISSPEPSTAMIPLGATIEVQGSGKPYLLRNVGGVFSCSCPSWRNQTAASDVRTCKHLRKVLGDEHEDARTKDATGRRLRTDEKAKLFGPKLMLAHPYTLDVDPTGWWWSEKLDGCRAYWNGTDFISRGGNVFAAPDFFKEGLPNFPLDGELYLGRQSFERTMSIVRRQDAGEEWRQVQYMVFDAPGQETFEVRLARAWHGLSGLSEYAQVLRHDRVDSPGHLQLLLEEYVARGSEGIMIRRPGSAYETKRSHALLKVKPFQDAEATVVGYEPGKGRHKGRLGALTVMLPDGQTFELGTGLTDADRENPPPVGTVVTYRYTELTNKGIPKCASYLRRHQT